MNKNKKNNFFQGGPKNLVILTLIFLGGVLLLHQFTDYARQIKPISYDAFLKRVEQGDVKQIRVSGTDVYGLFRDGSRFETVVGTTPKN